MGPTVHCFPPIVLQKSKHQLSSAQKLYIIEPEIDLLNMILDLHLAASY